jgi:Helicase conserved C-terminal domain
LSDLSTSAKLDVSEGFMLTIPQRQMSSCMAAACQSWVHEPASSPSDDDEFLLELVGDDGDGDEAVEVLATTAKRGKLMQMLHRVAADTGLARALASKDSKFDQLYANLKAYWMDHPGKKVVLFAFYKGTLYHLQRRLTELGISCVVLHGGKDKQAILKSFEDESGPQILLSSEVASEGVDLQFSSLLVNYDLPWNPAKVEQRIGRIDRIGQEAPKILIWNLVYADTLDERVHERLMERLNIFRSALGAMEDILGKEVKQLTRDLLSHRLSADDELRLIEQTAMVLVRQQRDQEELDQKATQLLGHGEFIQNKAKAARDLGRYVRGDDLYFFVKDYLEDAFPGSRILTSETQPREGQIELSTEARVAFDAFLREYRLIGKTSLLADVPRTFRFDNQAGQPLRGIEKITQDHPLVRFISERQKNSPKGPIYFPTSAVEVSAGALAGVEPGTYVYVIMRWTFSGPRDTERLVYEVRSLDSGLAMAEDLAEAFVNTAVLAGHDWYAVAKNTLDHARVASMQDLCSAAIEERFDGTKAMQLRANRDRIREMTAAIEQDLARKRSQVQEFLSRYAQSDQPRHKGLVKINQNKLKNLEQKFAEKKIALAQMEAVNPLPKEVSSGVIKVY